MNFDARNEAKLLIDLAMLVDRHGKGAVLRLGQMMADPAFAQHLAELLRRAAIDSDEGRANSGGLDAPARIRGPDRLARLSGRLKETRNSEHAEIAAVVEAVAESRVRLPGLKELQAFADGNGLRLSNARSRRDAFAEVVETLLIQSGPQRRETTSRLVVLLDPTQSALEGWDRIIERSGRHGDLELPSKQPTNPSGFTVE